MNKIYFVRHGETIANKDNVFRGRKDFPLNETGKKQAKDLGDLLKEVDFDLVFSSPLVRALETAQLVSPDNEIIKDELINNLDVGEWSGHEKSKIKEKFSEEWRYWTKNPETMQFKGGNSISFILSQTRKFLDKLEVYDNKTILIVSHRSVIKCLFANILDIESNFFWKLYFNNASYSVVNFNKKYGYTLMKMNESCHLKNFVTEKY